MHAFYPLYMVYKYRIRIHLVNFPHLNILLWNKNKRRIKKFGHQMLSSQSPSEKIEK